MTRTSDFVEAINKGATLVIALDPLVPYVSKQPGFARERGVFYNADQDIRTVSFTRDETTRNFVLRRHPEVSLYTFLPANNLRQLMSVNPMDHRPFLAIWRGAEGLEGFSKFQPLFAGGLARLLTTPRHLIPDGVLGSLLRLVERIKTGEQRRRIRPPSSSSAAPA